MRLKRQYIEATCIQYQPFAMIPSLRKILTSQQCNTLEMEIEQGCCFSRSACRGIVSNDQQHGARCLVHPARRKGREPPVGRRSDGLDFVGDEGQQHWEAPVRNSNLVLHQYHASSAYNYISDIVLPCCLRERSM